MMIRKRMLNFFNGKSIQAKLTGAIIFTSIISLLFACSSFLIANFVVTKSNFKWEINALFDLTSKNVIAPIYFLDPESAKDVLKSLKTVKDVHSAAIYLSNKKRFATYIRENDASKLNKLEYFFPKEPPLNEESVKEGRLNLTKKIFFKNELIGYLYLELDIKRYKQQLLLYVLIASIISFCSLWIAYTLSYYLKEILLSPILDLLKTVKRITSEKNYSYRARIFDNDEIGELICGFNDMIDRIESRDFALERNRANLENQVIERTMDLTNANIELKRLNNELLKAKKEADEASAAKSIFLASMSHELRTPLNGIIGYTQIIKKEYETLDKENLERINIISKCGEHLLHMINDILDLSKIEAGKLDIIHTSFAIEEFINTTAVIAKSYKKNQETKIKISIENNLPKSFKGDAKRIRQVLLNLLSNSIKFTQKGCISIDVKEVENKVRFEVKDTGIGIKEEDLNAIFDAFSQVGNVTHKSKGTGLGLAISNQLVKLMGGELKVESKPGKGSRFWFDIKLEKTDYDFLSSNDYNHFGYQKILSYKRSDNIKKPLKILIVDDMPENINILKTALEDTGFEILKASNGKEACDKVFDSDIDLIFMDIIMPEMNGIDATIKIKETLGDNSPVIIALSADTSSEISETVLKKGCCDLITKPFDLDKIFNAIKLYLKINWVYTNQEKTDFENFFKEPSPELKNRIHTFAKNGDISSIKNYCIQNKDDLNEDKAFIDKIEKLARQFKIKEIKMLTAPKDSMEK